MLIFTLQSYDSRSLVQPPQQNPKTHSIACLFAVVFAHWLISSQHVMGFASVASHQIICETTKNIMKPPFSSN